MKHEAHPGEHFSNETQFEDSRLASSSSSEWFNDLMSAEQGELKEQAQNLLAEQDRLQDRISELNERIVELRQAGNLTAITGVESEIKDCNGLLDRNADDLGYVYDKILKESQSKQIQELN